MYCSSVQDTRKWKNKSESQSQRIPKQVTKISLIPNDARSISYVFKICLRAHKATIPSYANVHTYKSLLSMMNQIFYSIFAVMVW